jgi:hypothetical protein
MSNLQQTLLGGVVPAELPVPKQFSCPLELGFLKEVHVLTAQNQKFGIVKISEDVTGTYLFLHTSYLLEHAPYFPSKIPVLPPLLAHLVWEQLFPTLLQE